MSTDVGGCPKSNAVVREAEAKECFHEFSFCFSSTLITGLSLQYYRLLTGKELFGKVVEKGVSLPLFSCKLVVKLSLVTTPPVF